MKPWVELEEGLVEERVSVEGRVPEWLEGALVRNGPVGVAVGEERPAHWFDGLAMLHAFSIRGGVVGYTNRFLRTRAYERVFERGKVDYDGFMQDPCRSLFKRFFTRFQGPSRPNAVVNVWKLAEEFVAVTESPLPIAFDLETLETKGPFVYEDRLPKRDCWESAHPHFDHRKGQMVNYLIEYGRKSTYTLYGVEAGARERVVLGRVPVEEPAYMHSFALTERYVVLAEFPYVVKPIDLLLGKEAFIKNFAWHPERGTTFIVVDRKDGRVVCRQQTDAFFAFHHANAFEEGGRLAMDVVTYRDPSIVIDVGADAEIEEATRLERFTLTLGTGELKREVLAEGALEFPRINERCDGYRHRFVYMTEGKGLAKVDCQTGEIKRWTEEGACSGEPVFVAKPGSEGEDEGVVLTICVDKGRGASFLLILDGETFEEVGRATVAHAIPIGLHGQFFWR